MKPSNKRIILGVVALVSIAAAVAGWCVLRDRQYAQSEHKNPVQSTDNVEDVAVSESDDASTWKTYRNENTDSNSNCRTSILFRKI